MDEWSEENGRKSCKTVQIFVKMEGSTTITLEVAPNDKVRDMMKRMPSGDDLWKSSQKK